MTYVIALPCVDVKDRACIDECPVDCIYEGERSLYIHPDECVDCGACEPVCPVEAIYYEDDLPDEWQDYYKANVEFFDDIGSPVVGAPFDERAGVVTNVEGRVVDESGRPVPGLYATGWIKRGPVGLIGHTKSDAMETIAHLVTDAEAGALRAPRVDDDILQLLDEREVEYTTWDGWLALDEHERLLGETHLHTRERVKVVPRDEQVRISRGALVR